MLHQFTWQHFLVASLILTLIWYAGVILIFYRKELEGLLKTSGKEQVPSGPLSHHWDEDVDTFPQYPSGSIGERLMGEFKFPEGISTVSSEDFGFSDSLDYKIDQVGLVPDILEEIKNVFNTLSQQDGTKLDFFNQMQIVKDNYPKIGEHPNLTQINDFISGHAPFYLSKEELENLWV